MPSAPESEAADGPAYDVMLGATGDSPQYGILGEVAGRRVALDLNQTHTISLFGVQGGGKSYTLGSSRRDGLASDPGRQSIAAATCDRDLPLQPDDGLRAGVHLDGGPERR